MSLGELPENIKRERSAGMGSSPPRSVKRDVRVVTRAKFATNVFKAMSTSNKTVLNANYNRNYLLIQNNGTSDVFVNFGAKASINSLKIVAGGNYEPFVTPIDSLYIISGAGLSNLCTVIEGIEIQ